MADSSFKMTLHDTIPFWFNTKFQACRNLLIKRLKYNGYDDVRNQNDNLSLSEVNYRKDQIYYLFRDYDEAYFYDLYLWVFLNGKENTIRLGVSYMVVTREDNVTVINEYYGINISHDYTIEQLSETGIFNEEEIKKIKDFERICNFFIIKYKERSLK